MNNVSLQPLQIIASVSFMTISLISLLTYILVLCILFLYFKEFKSNFYCVQISLALSNMAYLILLLFYAIPSTLLQKDIFENIPYLSDTVIGAIQGTCYYSQCIHLTYIAINRLAYACVSNNHKSILEKIFNNPWSVCSWIIFLWLASVSMPICRLVAKCVMRYDIVNMAFTFGCPVDDSTFVKQFADADLYLGGIYPGLITLFHVLAWVAISCRGTKGPNAQEFIQKRKREKRILIQFTLISTVLILWYISFWTIPLWFPGDITTVLITFFGIGSASVDPFLYLIFNRLMNKKARYLMSRLLGKTPNTVVDIHIGTSVAR